MVVYSLSDPDSGIVRYIGITSKTAKQRFQAHLKDAKTKRRKGEYLSRKEIWLLDLYQQGKRPIIQTLLSNLTKEEAEQKEIDLIANYGRMIEGGILYNVQEGGEYVSDMTTPWNRGLTGCYSKEFLENNKYNQPNAKKVYRYNKNGKLIDEWHSVRTMCSELHLDRRTVMRCLKGESNFLSHKDFMFSHEPIAPIYLNKSTLLTYDHSPHAKAIIVTTPSGEELKFNSIKQASETLHIAASEISNALGGRYQTYRKYSFKYQSNVRT